MRVGVVGSAGRMGTAICEAVEASPHHLVARVSRGDSIDALAKAGAEVVVDVTNVEAARQNLPWVALHGMHAIVGTTGFDDDDTRSLDETFRTAGHSCLLVPNFSIGAVLMMRFAAEAAPYFDNVEIVELHHDQKRDAPSGTAMLTASRIVDARGDIPPTASDVGASPAVARGLDVRGVRIHSVRARGLLAHQEVIMGAEGQTLTIRHDSFDRSSFMPGVIRSLDRVAALPSGVTIGLEAVL